MKKKKVKKLILVFVLTLMIITSNFYIYANDTKGANEILIQILNNADLSKINYLQGINIKENEYQEIQKFTLELVNNCKNDEEKENLARMFKENEDKYQEDLREKYNPDNIFKNRKNEDTESNNLPVVIKKENLFIRALNFIKDFFRNKR